MTELELERPPRHRVSLLVNVIIPAVAVLALFGLVAQRVDTNTALAREAKRGVTTTCNAVKASNDVTIEFLRESIVPAPTDERYVEAKAFVDGLEARYTAAFDRCVAGAGPTP